jgi:hypothetical protein
MARKRYWAYAVDGGTAGAMDAIDGASLSVGDICEVHNASTHSIYYLAESASTENSPHIVTPDSNAGDKRWELAFPSLNPDTSARGYWSDGTDGANIHKIRDRAFVGDACDYDGNETVAANSWVGDLGDGTSMVWLEKNATFAAFTSQGIGGVFAARGDSQEGTGGAAIGVVGYGYNMLGDSTHSAYGAYIEGVRDTDGGNTLAAEFDITNLATSPRTDLLNPYNTWTAGTTVGVHIASGGDALVWPTSYDADAGLTFIGNGAKFDTGIVFRNSALTRDDGATGPAHAILLGYDHHVEWYEYGTNTKSCYITSNITDASHDQGLLFYNGGLKYVNGSGETIFLAQDNQNTVANYCYVAGSVAGTSPFLGVAGTDTHIDLRLIPKGTAYVSFGARIANSDAAITGYIAIKDSAGTIRKLALID